MSESKAKSEESPTWQFWRPLGIWKVLLVFLICNLITTFLFVAIRELLKVNVPQWPAGGIGALLSLFVIARLRGARLPTPPIV